MKREKTQISKIRNEKGEITNTKKIQGIIKDYFESLHSNKLGNPEKMGKFLVIYHYPKLNQEDINHQIISKTHSKIEAEIKILTKKKISGPDRLSPEFYETFKEELTLTLP
jgi:hypothetical protein